MPKIKFSEDVIYETEGYKKGERFEKGEIYDLSDEHAERWVRRNVAKLVKEKDEKKTKDEKEPKAEEPPVTDEPADGDDEEGQEEEEEGAEGEAQPTMPRRRGRPPKVR